MVIYIFHADYIGGIANSFFDVCQPEFGHKRDFLILVSQSHLIKESVSARSVGQNIRVEVCFKQKSFAWSDKIENVVEYRMYGKFSPYSLFIFIGNLVIFSKLDLMVALIE